MQAAKRIIVNADDFGYREDINRGIIYAHKNGIVKSATILTDREAFESAVSLAKENPGLKTGLHLDLDGFFDILRPEGKIGDFKSGTFDKYKITDSINRQTDKFLHSGLRLSHIDGHHHAHLHPLVLPIVANKAKEFNIPLRFFGSFYNDPALAGEMAGMLDGLGVKYCPHFINGWYWRNVDENFELAELMTHPGFNEMWREFEIAKCCDPVLKAYLAEKNIEIISFEDII